MDSDKLVDNAVKNLCKSIGLDLVCILKKESNNNYSVNNPVYSYLTGLGAYLESKKGVVQLAVETSDIDGEYKQVLFNQGVNLLISCPLECEDNKYGFLVGVSDTPVPLDEEYILDIKDCAKSIASYFHNLYENKRIKEATKKLLSIASHDLRNPLTSIKGMFEILNMFKKDIPDKLHNIIDNALKSTDIMESHIDEFLDLYKFEGGNLMLRKKPSNIYALIYECYTANLKRAQDRGHDFVINIEPSLEKTIINIDANKIKASVLNNLISNAIKYTPRNGRIELSMTLSSECVEISVQDNGAGFTKEEINNMFKMYGNFNRENMDLDTSKSTGIGLYSAYEVVKLHGGELTVESEGRSKGSKFTFTLPV